MGDRRSPSPRLPPSPFHEPNFQARNKDGALVIGGVVIVGGGIAGVSTAADKPASDRPDLLESGLSRARLVVFGAGNHSPRRNGG